MKPACFNDRDGAAPLRKADPGTGSDRVQAGFTLLELLMVITLVAILAVLLLPALQQAKLRAKTVACASQLRQVGLAFHDFAHSHDDRFPMQVSTNAGGSLEFVRAAETLGGPFYFAFRHFQPLSNTLDTPRILVCPADIYRQPASDFVALRNEHVSYFVGVNAEYRKPDSILAGDWNISRAASGVDTAIRLGTNDPIEWFRLLHQDRGNVVFSDGRVETLKNRGLQAALRNSPLPVNILLPPAKAPEGPTRQLSPSNQPSRSQPSTGGLAQLERLFPRGVRSSNATSLVAVVGPIPPPAWVEALDRIPDRVAAPDKPAVPAVDADPAPPANQPEVVPANPPVSTIPKHQKDSSMSSPAPLITTRTEHRFPYWLLALLLILVGLEVIRRLRKKLRARSADSRPDRER